MCFLASLFFSVFYTCSSHVVEQGFSTFSNHSTHGKWCLHLVLEETRKVFGGWRELDWGIDCPGFELLSPGWLREKYLRIFLTHKSTSSELWIDLKMWDLEISKQRFISRHKHLLSLSVSSVNQSCLILCDPKDCSTPGLPVHRQLPGFTQTHVHWVSVAIQSSHPLSSSSPPAFNLSQQERFPFSGSFQMGQFFLLGGQVLEFQLQH